MDPLFAAAGRAMVTPTPMGRERAELITVGSFLLGLEGEEDKSRIHLRLRNVSLTVDSTGRLHMSDSKALSLAMG